MERALVRTVALLLDQLATAERLSNDERESVHGELAAQAGALPADGFLAALDAAVGKNAKRRKASIHLLCWHANLPAVQERIGASLDAPDPEWRRWLIQTVGARRLVQFAPGLNQVIREDSDLFARQFAIMAAAELRQAVNLSALLALGEDHGPDLRGQWVWALKEYAREECRPGLWAVMADPQGTPTGRTREEWGLAKEDRVIAAWGLAKLGEPDAVAYLTRMLDDPDVRLPNGFRPGVSLRAAQALCDLNNWPFRSGPDAVRETQARLAGATPI